MPVRTLLVLVPPLKSFSVFTPNVLLALLTITTIAVEAKTRADAQADTLRARRGVQKNEVVGLFNFSDSVSAGEYDQRGVKEIDQRGVKAISWVMGNSSHCSCG